MKLGNNLARIALESTSIEFESEIVMKEFDALLGRVATAMYERTYQEEETRRERERESKQQFTNTYNLKLGKNLARIAMESTSIEFESEIVTKEFDALLGRVATAMYERTYQEEQNILNNNESFQ